jgi:electron transport complex protein RnfD
MQFRPFIAAPFAHSGRTTSSIMFWVIVALLPATIFGLGLYGWPAIYLWAITIFSSVLTEALCLKLAGKSVKAGLRDNSAVLSGWILALALPPWAPWWVGVVGGVVAIGLAKHAFGGLGQNLFNPAMVARIALVISFPVELTRYVAPRPIFTASAPDALQSLAITFGVGSVDLDALSSASLLGHAKSELSKGTPLTELSGTGFDPISLLLGTTTGSMGETSAVLLLLGGLILLATRVITWHIPVAVLVGVLIPASIAHAVDPGHYLPPLVHLLAASTLFGAFFIATDLVTSPTTAKGQILYGIGIGVLIFVIRSWGAYPEGMAFAVLLMNAATPLIDRWVRPRIYGRNRKGQPLAIKSKETR